jgi:hypothetical protein
MRDDTRQPRPESADRYLDQLLGTAHFSERHRRAIRAPADRVWSAVLAVTPGEVRLLALLMAVRSLPAALRRRKPAAGRAGQNDRAAFVDQLDNRGFLQLHRDPGPTGGRAFMVYGAAGRFWSPTGNSPLRFDGRQAFVEYAQPGMAKAAVSVEVVDRGAHTDVITETRVVGTDAAARRAFALYWLLIRGPSGLIRRNWLAAIDRRATS